MKTIQQLLADKPIALAHLEGLVSLHDVWIVGGAARALLYDLPFPTDIDVLLNTETSSTSLEAKPADEYGQDQQKQIVGDVNFDVFHNGLVKWLAGGPCAGDGLAVRAKDNFVLQTWEHENRPWAEVNGRYTGRNPEYMERHQLSLRRDLTAYRRVEFHSAISPEAFV